MKQLKEALAYFGINLYDEEGNIRTVYDLFTDLNKVVWNEFNDDERSFLIDITGGIKNEE